MDRLSSRRSTGLVHHHLNRPGSIHQSPRVRPVSLILLHRLTRRVRSLIVSIKASEIVEGKDYGAGFTLRFPRAIKLREDKSPGDAMRFSEMLAAKSTGTKRAVTGDLSARAAKRTTVVRAVSSCLSVDES